jgi:hypothetical protein
MRLPVRALTATRKKALDDLELFAEELSLELRVRDRDREDSLERTIPLRRAARGIAGSRVGHRHLGGGLESRPHLDPPPVSWTG